MNVGVTLCNFFLQRSAIPHDQRSNVLENIDLGGGVAFQLMGAFLET